VLSLLLCAIAFLLVYQTARRDLASGLISLLVVGYIYGIVRANVLQPFSHFTFDAATAGLFLAQLGRKADPATAWSERALRSWMLLLVGWPMLLALIPVQDPMVQLVGLRGNVFFVPFLLLGARLTTGDLSRLAIAVAVMNILAFGVGLAEFFVGIEPFFPPSAVTDIMYRSRDVAGHTAHRIPATFSSAHAYGGSMVMTMPLLLGAWTERIHLSRAKRVLVSSAILASGIGILMSAARMHAIVLFTLLAFTTLSSRMSLGGRVTWILLLTIGGMVAGSNERLQRFTTLEDQEYVQNRISGSVNNTFFEFAREYPLGNGLGGGGTSMPYFLADRLRDPVLLENEYGRIMLEQGIPGLLIWLTFVVWVISRGIWVPQGSWRVFRRLAWVATSTYLLLGFLGLGLLTAIPQSPLLLAWLGYVAARRPRAAPHAAADEVPYADRLPGGLAERPTRPA
jgi:hypothetical protein